MGKEIERKFLVVNDAWRRAAKPGLRTRQGYLHVGPPVAVRARIMGGKATLNVKKSTLDISRDEFEYAIPMEDAEALLARLCEGYIIEKTRYLVDYAGMTWEVDVFEGVNEGLVVAEIELESEDQQFEKPPWAGQEVSGDARYLNTHLSREPYKEWPR